MSGTIRTTPDPERSGVTVHEAADTLGISEVAVRARLRRGTLEGEKVDDIWRVYLRTADVPERSADTHHDTHREAQHGTQRHVPPDALVEQLRHEREHLQGEIDYLREQLAGTIDQLAKERERADVLQREALGRIEALSASVSDDTDDQAQPPQHEETHTPAGMWARLLRLWRGG